MKTLLSSLGLPFLGLFLLAGCTAASTPPATADTSNPAGVAQTSTNANPSLQPGSAATTRASLELAREKIGHVIIIMQENRSFDEYFGTFPGADGIPMKQGQPTVCLPDPKTTKCVKPFHDSRDINAGGPHAAASARTDINGGKMDGFVATFRQAQKACTNPDTPGCAAGETPDVMGWHDAREIPNYWTYARNFVLQDRMFEPNASWSLPSHLFMVSAWSAECPLSGNPKRCTNALDGPVSIFNAIKPEYAWTDLTYLLHKAGVSWAYYLSEGDEADCSDEMVLCQPKPLQPKVPGIMNPLPNFETVRENGQLSNIQIVENFFTAAKEGILPAVSWIVPELQVSEHPPTSISAGQAYVTSLINAVMQGPDWSDSVIFLAWDDWGGFYDHVQPPIIDINGYGLRVPGLVIGPYVKNGFIDHQTLSFDAYLKFIEDIFLNGQRIDSKTDGRPDARPTVREDVPQLGDLINDFDFSQPPRPALILPINPLPDDASVPGI
jgi:phospholipase C